MEGAGPVQVEIEMIRDRAGSIRRRHGVHARPRAGAGVKSGIGVASVVASCVAFFAAVFAAPAVAQDAMLSVEETESLVRARYYEGLPKDLAARIGPEGCDRLVEMLADPAEARHHDQILVAIGICAPEGGLEAIGAWLGAMPEGEIDRPRFKAWLAVNHALGELAEHDPRALAILESRMIRPDAPRFRHGRHRGARLLKMRRFGAAHDLAETGLPAAADALDRADLQASDGEFVGHLRAARARHGERVEERRQKRRRERAEDRRAGRGRNR